MRHIYEQIITVGTLAGFSGTRRHTPGGRSSVGVVRWGVGEGAIGVGEGQFEAMGLDPCELRPELNTELRFLVSLKLADLTMSNTPDMFSGYIS